MKTYYSKLDSRGVLSIEGPDSDTFLQGQTTCDLKQLGADHAINGCYCTPQGRTVADFRILQIDHESRLLGMHHSLCKNTAAVFGKYIVFSKAEIRDASDEWEQFGLWGEDSAALFEEGPGQKNSCWQSAGAFWVQLDDSAGRFQAYVPAGRAAEFANWLQQGAEARPEQDWELTEINAGEAHLQGATAEMFIPQMLNYQLTGHISFSKGCYTGQEVVARMHYRGKLKRPMYLASLSEGQAPEAGQPLYKAGSEQSVGNVVNHTRDGEGHRLLAVISSDALESGVHLGDHSGPRLDILDLPYSLEAE